MIELAGVPDAEGDRVADRLAVDAVADRLAELQVVERLFPNG